MQNQLPAGADRIFPWRWTLFSLWLTRPFVQIQETAQSRKHLFENGAPGWASPPAPWHPSSPSAPSFTSAQQTLQTGSGERSSGGTAATADSLTLPLQRKQAYAGEGHQLQHQADGRGPRDAPGGELVQHEPRQARRRKVRGLCSGLVQGPRYQQAAGHRNQRWAPAPPVHVVGQHNPPACTCARRGGVCWSQGPT